MKKLLLSLLLGLACSSALRAEDITSGGQTRQMVVYAPKNLGENRPLLISMHGYNQDMNYQRNQANYEAVADTAKFVVVYPNGIGNADGSGRGWDTGGSRDINFILDIIEAMHKRYKINKNRVYLSGFSMGGMMTYAAMNKIGDKIAAFAPCSGYNMGGPVTTSSRPLPLLHVHGTSDDVCNYSPVMSHVEAWAKRNKCNMTPIVQKPKSGPANTTAELIRYVNGEKGVEVAHLKLPGKGHWHSNDAAYAMTNVEIWNFCRRWALVDGPVVKKVVPEDGSFDMETDVHRQFQLTLDKPITLSAVKATLNKGTTKINLKAELTEDGKELTLSLPATSNPAKGDWTLSVTGIESTDGGSTPEFTARYRYGVEEVGEVMKIDTLYQSAWDTMQETIGMGIPKGWRVKITDSSDKVTTMKHTDSIAVEKASHLVYFDDESDFNTGFQFYPYKNKKVELYTYDTSSRAFLKSGKVVIRFSTAYLNAKSRTNKFPLYLTLTNASDNTVAFQSAEILPANYMRKSSTVTGSNVQEFVTDISRAARYNISLSAEHTPATTANLDCIIMSDILITTAPSPADQYKGEFLRKLAQARELCAQLQEMMADDSLTDGENLAKLYEDLDLAIGQWESFTSIQPSEYTAALKALEEAMKPALAVGLPAVTSPASSPASLYDLQGRKLQPTAIPQKGIYIKDGRKVLMVR